MSLFLRLSLHQEFTHGSLFNAGLTSSQEATSLLKVGCSTQGLFPFLTSPVAAPLLRCPSAAAPAYRFCPNIVNGRPVMSALPTSTLDTQVTAQTPADAEQLISEKKAHSEAHSESSDHSESKHPAPVADPTVLAAREEADLEADKERNRRHYLKYRPFILGGLAFVILGWWISATVLPATRHRWFAIRSEQLPDADVGPFLHSQGSYRPYGRGSSSSL
jgi:hypothetical protein